MNFHTERARFTFHRKANLIFAAGRTFRSGYLNVPVNVFVSPRKDGTVVGLSFGFNIQKRSNTGI